MDEVIAAANKCGFPCPTADALEQMKRTETMGAYKPSTLIDFEAGKPLEIEAIWGEPFRRAAARRRLDAAARRVVCITAGAGTAARNP